MRPYTFNIAPFLADKNVVQQGFVSGEPYAMRQAGVDPVVMLIADAGYENYGTTIATSQEAGRPRSRTWCSASSRHDRGLGRSYLKGGPTPRRPMR